MMAYKENIIDFENLTKNVLDINSKVRNLRQSLNDVNGPHKEEIKSKLGIMKA